MIRTGPDRDGRDQGGGEEERPAQDELRPQTQNRARREPDAKSDGLARGLHELETSEPAPPVSVAFRLGHQYLT